MKCPAPCDMGQIPAGGLPDMGPVPSPGWPVNGCPVCDSTGWIIGLRVSRTAFISTLEARFVSMAIASGESSSCWSGTVQSCDLCLSTSGTICA